jgi:putative membrane protein
MIGSVIVGLNIAHFFPQICLPLIAKSEMAEEVNRRAAECFYNYNLGNTKKGSALLIYVSNYEHIAVVKTDLRSGKKLSSKNLQEICDLVIDGIKNKNAAHGLILAIEKSGALLKQHFPNNSHNPDELENKIYLI